MTRIGDLSSRDMKKITPLALIELTALYDILGLDLKRSKAGKWKGSGEHACQTPACPSKLASCYTPPPPTLGSVNLNCLSHCQETLSVVLISVNFFFLQVETVPSQWCYCNPVLGRLRQEDLGFVTNLGYIARFCLKKRTKHNSCSYYSVPI